MEQSYKLMAHSFCYLPRQSYIVLTFLGFNDCGPNGQIFARFGAIKVKQDVRLCPGGKHEADWEHVTLELDDKLTYIKRVYVAYHSFGKWYRLSELTTDGNHPVVFMALGSHALYRKQGDNKYLQLWNKYYNKKFLPTMETYGHFIDHAATMATGYKWKPSIRWISINGKPRSSASRLERLMSIYQGRGGVEIVNHEWRKIQDTILSITKPIRKLSSKADHAIRDGLKEGDGEMQSAASSGLGNKGWWSNDASEENDQSKGTESNLLELDEEDY